jgi:hypothetical protein
MTVLDAMQAAKASKHGIDFEFTGKAETAFLVRIDDVKNHGGGAGKRNWLYSVNDVPGDRSFGVFELGVYELMNAISPKASLARLSDSARPVATLT